MPVDFAARPRMSPAVVVMMLTLLLGIQPVTTDLYLPALPTLTLALHTGVAAAQATLSALIIAFGFAQLACGPLADRFAYIAGTWLCRRLLATRGLRRAVKLGGALSLAGGIGAAALSLAGWHTVWALLIPQWFYALGHGIHQPCGQAGAVGPFPEKAGTAASLSGFIMMLVAFGVSQWLGQALNGTVYPLSVGLGAFSIGVAVVAFTLVQQHGEAPAAFNPGLQHSSV